MTMVTAIAVTLPWDKPTLVEGGLVQIKKEMATICRTFRSATLGLSCLRIMGTLLHEGSCREKSNKQNGLAKYHGSLFAQGHTKRQDSQFFFPLKDATATC